MKTTLHSKGLPSRNIIHETGMASNSVIVKNVNGKSEYIDNKKESRRVYSRILVTCSNSQKGGGDENETEGEKQPYNAFSIRE